MNVALLSAALVLTAACAVAYCSPTPGDAPLRSEQANACAVQKALVPGTPLWVMGNPIPLVLLHRVNPDNYPYVGSGLDQWKIDHTAGGFAGWTAQVRRSRASVVVVDVSKNAVDRERMQRWLHEHGYVPGSSAAGGSSWQRPASTRRIEERSAEARSRTPSLAAELDRGALHR